MKKTVRITALIMSLVIALMCLVACNDDKTSTKPDPKKEKVEKKNQDKEKMEDAFSQNVEQNENIEQTSGNNDEEEQENAKQKIKAVVDSYTSGYTKEISTAGELKENVKKYILGGSDAEKSIDEYVKKLENSSDDSATSGVLADYEKELFLILHNVVNSETTYKIKSVKVGEKSIVKVEKVVPDVDVFDTDGKYTSAVMGIIMKYLSEKGIGLNVLMSKDQEKLDEIKNGFLSECSGECMELIKGMVEKENKKTIEMTFTVEKENDKWLISKIAE